MPASMLRRRLTGLRGLPMRGRARNPTPNALTIAATPSPVVSATAPTASGVASARMVCVPGRGVDQRLDQQPFADEPGAQRQPARPERGHPEQRVVAGIRRASPPSRSRSRSPVAASTDPAARKPSLLNAACAIRCSMAAASAIVAVAVAPEAGEQGRGAERQGDQPHVLGRRIGKQPFEIRGDRGLQHPEQRGQPADDQQGQPPPARARAEQLQVEPDDAVDAQVDHRRAHQRRHRARRLRMGARQPGVQRQQPRLRPEPHHGQQKTTAVRALRASGSSAANRSAPTGGRQHHQPDQDRHEPELGHHRVQQRRPSAPARGRARPAPAPARRSPSAPTPSRNVVTDPAAGTSSIAATNSGSTTSATGSGARAGHSRPSRCRPEPRPHR